MKNLYNICWCCGHLYGRSKGSVCGVWVDKCDICGIETTCAAPRDYCYLPYYKNLMKKIDDLISNKGFINIPVIEKDRKGRIIKFTNGGITWEYTFDRFGRQDSVRNNKGVDTEIKYSKSGNVLMFRNKEYWVRTRYNKRGLVLKKWDSNGIIESFEYDRKNNITYSSKQTDDGFLMWSKKTFDSKGRILTNTFSNIDGSEYSEVYTYDKKGNNIKYSNSDGEWSLFTYDHKNRLVLSTSQSGIELNRVYDKKGNMIYEKNGDGELIVDGTTKLYITNNGQHFLNDILLKTQEDVDREILDDVLYNDDQIYDNDNLPDNE